MTELVTKTVTFRSTTAASFECGNNLSKEIEKRRKIWYTIQWSIIITCKESCNGGNQKGTGRPVQHDI